jgi:DNA polymerase-3 subunit delta
MPDTTVLVFVEKEVDKRNKLYKYVSKNGLAVEMGAMSAKEMKLWVASLLKETNCRMRESTAEYFLEQVENSMTNVKNELDKLIAYTYGREEITKEDIDRVCSVQITGKIFQMMDAVAVGNREETLRYYHDLLTLRESPMSILYLLSRHFHILLQIKSMQGKADKSAMAKQAGVPPFAVGKYQSQCRRFSEETLRQMLESCIETEYQFKRGNLGDQIGVELLLVSFC